MTTTTTWPTTADGKYLVLRTVDADWRSRDGFRWRKTVETVASDWDPNPDRDCGGGLHGLMWGCGEAGLLSSAPDAVWLVVAVDPTDVVNPDQPHKVRFRAGQVRFHGTRDEAVDYLMAHGAVGLPVAYGRHAVKDYGTATAGNDGTAIAGNYGTAIAGNYGTATAGYHGTATAGNYGTATAGYGGTATAGDYGTLIITWHDGARSRRAVGYVGEGGIKPDTPYRVNGQGEFYEVNK